MSQAHAQPLRVLLVALTLSALVQPLAAQARDQRVDAVFARWDRSDAPGCALGVYRDGQMAYQRGYGMANLEHKIPITPTTVFYVGSVSKQFVAFSIALLQERGALSFDDDIRMHVPEMPAYAHTITIRHLLHHTSGLRDYLTLAELAGRDILDDLGKDEMLGLVARQRELNFSPGAEYLYSNSGYLLLAEIVERVSGSPLRAFAAKEIFTPLSMTRSHFHDDNTHIVPSRAEGHQLLGNDGWGLMRQRFALVGSGGLYTTVTDLFMWDQNFYSNHLGKGSQALIDTTLTRGVLTSGDTISYALALTRETYRGLPVVEHSGALGGYRAHLLRFPQQRFTAVVLCNFADAAPGTYARRVADIYLSDQLASLSPTAAQPRQPAPARSQLELTGAQLDEYAGAYWSEELGVRYRVSVEDGGLALQVGNNAKSALTLVDGDVARSALGVLRFQRDATTAITGFRLEAGRVRNIGFARQ